MAKKILIFSLAYYPHVGGAEIAIKEITDRISPDDIEFHLITLRFSPEEVGEEKIGNVHVHRIGRNKNYLSKILFIPRAAYVALTMDVRRFDALWSMMTYMLFPVVLLRLLGVKTPYVLTLQDGDPFAHVFGRWFIRPLVPLLRFGFRRAAVVQAISQFLGRWAREFGFAGPLEIIPNGVDIPNFSRAISETRRAELVATLNKKEGDVFLITSSRLVHKNALDDVIRALALLPAHIQFLVLGDGKEEGTLRTLSKECGVESRVHFLGYIGHEELPDYLHVSDIFIRPSRSEGMGSAFVEAFASGIPVVATQEGGIADFLFDAKRNPEKEPTGFAVAVNSPQNIAEVVQEILTHTQEVAAIVARARLLAQEKYGWDSIARDMRAKVFSRVL
jgi:glycosyltransferase involved in cell wall biosynthesis